jgi:hypothetical protein
MTKHEIKILDTIWSYAVKEKYDFKCAWSGETTNLNSHHVISRIIYILRWDLENGLCLTVKYHKFDGNSIHNNPIIWENRLNELGIKKDKLLKRENEIYLNDFYCTIEKLKSQCEELHLSNSLKLIDDEYNKHEKSVLRLYKKKDSKRKLIQKKQLRIREIKKKEIKHTKINKGVLC